MSRRHGAARVVAESEGPTTPRAQASQFPTTIQKRAISEVRDHGRRRHERGRKSPGEGGVVLLSWHAVRRGEHQGSGIEQDMLRRKGAAVIKELVDLGCEGVRKMLPAEVG